MEKYLKKHCRAVYQHFHKQETTTMGASFSSCLITLFIYDSDFSVATKIFELFLLDGEQVLVDLLAGMIFRKK